MKNVLPRTAQMDFADLKLGSFSPSPLSRPLPTHLVTTITESLPASLLPSLPAPFCPGFSLLASVSLLGPLLLEDMRSWSDFQLSVFSFWFSCLPPGFFCFLVFFASFGLHFVFPLPLSSPSPSLLLPGPSFLLSLVFAVSWRYLQAQE